MKMNSHTQLSIQTNQMNFMVSSKDLNIWHMIILLNMYENALFILFQFVNYGRKTERVVERSHNIANIVSKVSFAVDSVPEEFDYDCIIILNYVSGIQSNLP